MSPHREGTDLTLNAIKDFATRTLAEESYAVALTSFSCMHYRT